MHREKAFCIGADGSKASILTRVELIIRQLLILFQFEVHVGASVILNSDPVVHYVPSLCLGAREFGRLAGLEAAVGVHGAPGLGRAWCSDSIDGPAPGGRLDGDLIDQHVTSRRPRTRELGGRAAEAFICVFGTSGSLGRAAVDGHFFC